MNMPGEGEGGGAGDLEAFGPFWVPIEVEDDGSDAEADDITRCIESRGFGGLITIAESPEPNGSCDQCPTTCLSKSGHQNNI
jgi:hypothetical protein